jgi:hypothetical protein
LWSTDTVGRATFNSAARSEDKDKELIHISSGLHVISGNKFQSRKYAVMTFINDISRVNVVIYFNVPVK